MRKQFCDAIAQRSQRADMVFLTGDLGFMALEPVRDVMGERFINAGVSEQNMISVAAALARQRFDVWVYSIAPFCYARPFEQIRNDISFHNLPVTIVGNGGGYGYGVMGSTHHAIEDYGVLLTLDNMQIYAPAFEEDVATVVDLAGDCSGPSYLRLGRGEAPPGFEVPAYAPWRLLTRGGGPHVVAVGPLAGTYIRAFLDIAEAERPNLWVVCEMPVHRYPPPEELVAAVVGGAALVVAEEHVAQGGFGAALVMHLAERRIAIQHFRHLAAKTHTFSRYGSQAYLRAQSGLDVDSVLRTIANADLLTDALPTMAATTQSSPAGP